MACIIYSLWQSSPAPGLLVAEPLATDRRRGKRQGYGAF